MHLLVAFVFGLIFGSFFNVCILRIPKKLSLWGRSACPRCQKVIVWQNNIPLLSYFWLKGKCKDCQEHISWQYPTVEFVSGCLFAVLYFQNGFTTEFFAYTFFFSVLLVISVIDIHLYLIPDSLSLPGILIGFLLSFFALPIGWKESLYGILAGGGVFFSVAYLYEKITKKEGLGGGDVKLLAMIGAWLGIQSILPVVIVSSFLGSVLGVTLLLFRKRDFKSFIPFGPFLAAGALLYYFFQQEFLLWLFPSLD